MSDGEYTALQARVRRIMRLPVEEQTPAINELLDSIEHQPTRVLAELLWAHGLAVGRLDGNQSGPGEPHPSDQGKNGSPGSGATDESPSNLATAVNALTPQKFIDAGLKAHPAAKYGAVIAAFGGIVTVFVRYGVSLGTVVFGIIVMIALMVLFLLFARAVDLGRGRLAKPVMFMVWSVLLLSVTVMALLVTSAFFNQPLPLRALLVRQLDIVPDSAAASLPNSGAQATDGDSLTGNAPPITRPTTPTDSPPSIFTPQVSRPPMPTLLCVDAPGDERNALTLRARTECEGCNPDDNTQNQWGSPSLAAHSSWIRPDGETGWLNADARAHAKVSCRTNGEVNELSVETSLAALAGWGGKQPPYRSAMASVSGSGSTGFHVAESHAFCLWPTRMVREGSQRKGYATATVREHDDMSRALFRLQSPNGRSTAVQLSDMVLLDQSGFWRIGFEVDDEYTSTQSENSARQSFKNAFEFRFVRTTDGSCPGG